MKFRVERVCKMIFVHSCKPRQHYLLMTLSSQAKADAVNYQKSIEERIDDFHRYNDILHLFFGPRVLKLSLFVKKAKNIGGMDRTCRSTHT